MNRGYLEIVCWLAAMAAASGNRSDADAYLEGVLSQFRSRGGTACGRSRPPLLGLGCR